MLTSTPKWPCYNLDGSSRLFLPYCPVTSQYKVAVQSGGGIGNVARRSIPTKVNSASYSQYFTCIPGARRLGQTFAKMDVRSPDISAHKVPYNSTYRSSTFHLDNTLDVRMIS